MMTWRAIEADEKLDRITNDHEYARAVLAMMRDDDRERSTPRVNVMAYIAPLFMVAAFVWALARIAHAWGF